MQIEENGGQNASLLGIRSMHGEVPLASLNDGRGVDSVDGDDLRITTADGTFIDVDINALDLQSATLQDLADLLNAAGGGRITVDFAPSGGGLRITDNTVGAGTLSIAPLNLSPTLRSLGLDGLTAAAGTLVGRDVNPIRVDSPFTALLELRAALEADDSRAIGFAAARLEGNLDDMLRVQGRLAATARDVLDRTERVQDEQTATTVLRSDVADVDLTEALVRFQQVQTALQANLSTSSRILSLSLLDYLQ
jgi:flagellin-like hook-associated protein FlgL